MKHLWQCEMALIQFVEESQFSECGKPLHPACKKSMHLAGKSGFGNIYKQKDKRDPLSDVKKHWLLHSSCLEKLPVKFC